MAAKLWNTVVTDYDGSVSIRNFGGRTKKEEEANARALCKEVHGTYAKRTDAEGRKLDCESRRRAGG